MPGRSQINKQKKEKIRAMRQKTAQLQREGKFWSNGDRERLSKLFYKNKGITEIALDLERTEVAVMQQIQQMNLYGKVRNTYHRREEGCRCRNCPLRKQCQKKDDCPYRNTL